MGLVCFVNLGHPAHVCLHCKQHLQWRPRISSARPSEPVDASAKCDLQNKVYNGSTHEMIRSFDLCEPKRSNLMFLSDMLLVLPLDLNLAPLKCPHRLRGSNPHYLQIRQEFFSQCLIEQSRLGLSFESGAHAYARISIAPCRSIEIEVDSEIFIGHAFD